jgi:uncharacterized protein (TIGR00369 family)
VTEATPHGEAARSATFEWTDPRVALPELPKLSGLEYLTRLKDGVIPPPPIAALMRFELVAVSEGEVEFSCLPDEAHFNILGTVHGGLACTLLDTVLGCAVHSSLPVGTGYTSIDIAVSYVRAIQPGPRPLSAKGRVTKAGSRVSFAEGRITDADGRLLASATGSLLVFPIAGDAA